MSDMKCPFCGQELEEDIFYSGRVFVSCNNPKCPIMDWGGCSKQIVTELIRTRKALDVAKDTIRHADWFFDGDYNVDAKTMHSEIKCAIKGITILEQKDK